MNLIGASVKHKKFGDGLVTGQLKNKISISFGKEEKLFVYPDAFPEFLTLDNQELQDYVVRLSEKQERRSEAKLMRFLWEHKHRKRLRAMKILNKSQVVYNIPTEVTAKLELLETGNILSGVNKGLARVPSKVQPNTAILLTQSLDGREDSRKIIGLAMVDSYFWGKECKDGQIKLHQRYQLFFAPEQQPKLWDYFSAQNFAKKWGDIPFKYVVNSLMDEAVFRLCTKLLGTDQEQAAKEFYQYYCFVNQLDELPLGEAEKKQQE